MSNLANEIKKAKSFLELFCKIKGGGKTGEEQEEKKFCEALTPIIDFHYNTFSDLICNPERIKSLLKDIKELSNSKEYKNNSDISKIVKEIENKINELREYTKEIQEKHDILKKYSYRKLYDRMQDCNEHFEMSSNDKEDLKKCIKRLSTLKKKKYELIDDMEKYLKNAKKTDFNTLITEFNQLFNDTKQLEIHFEGLEESITCFDTEVTKKIQEKHDILKKYSYRKLYDSMQDCNKYFEMSSNNKEDLKKGLKKCITDLLTLREKKYKLIDDMEKYLKNAKKTDFNTLITEFDKLFNDTKQLKVHFDGLKESITCFDTLD